MSNKITRYETQIQLIPSSIKQLNKQFALVDILLCYHGKNRNMTSINKEVIEAALPSLYGIPIVGEYIYLDDGTQDFGSHGGKIIISDQGIKFEDTTRPYGFITKDAVDNAKWITITEKDGITNHEYLELKGCVIWYKRYEEVSALLDKNYGQSMEIEICSYEYDSDGYCNIKELNFSAVCILGSNPDGTDVIPCFESACIGRHYELDSFKQEFSFILEEYKKLNKTSGISTNQTKPTNSKMKGEQKMDFTKIVEVLSTIKCNNNEKVCKYKLLNVTDSKVFALDIEDYKPYSFDYVITKDDENEFIVIDFESKVEMSLSAIDKITDKNFKELNIKDEIDIAISKFSKEQEIEFNKKIENVSKEISEKFQKDYDELKEAYDSLVKAHNIMQTKVDAYEKKENEAKIEQHKNEINTLVDSYADKLGKYSAFLVYKANIEQKYSMTTEQVEHDLILMAGKYLTSKESSLNKKFSYNPIETGVTNRTNDVIINRYGHLLDKYIK